MIMKNKSIPLASVLLTGVLLIPSCKNPNDPLAPNRDNPLEAVLPAAPFGITLLDHERGHAKDSVYCFEGVWKDDAFRFGLERLDPMVPNILPEGRNRLEFRISSDDAGFRGVNAASSSRCINIVQDGSDHLRYHLEWVAEGESTITFWNGEGSARREIAFKATSWKEIPMEGISFRYDGFLYRFHKWVVSENYHDGQETYGIVRSWNPKREDLDYLPVLEIVGPVPLNATEGVMCLSLGIDETIPSSGNDHDMLYGKKVSAEEYNLRFYDGFRWFPTTVKPPYPPEGYIHADHADIPFEVKRKYAEELLACYQRILPSDLRERRVKIWKNTTSSFTSRDLTLTMGIFSPDETIQLNQDGEPIFDLGDVRYNIILQ
jgi:hypothetical protein